MDKIALKNFRCFGARQVARLAPLTLLVGENSTGKTSFLALIRALWEAAIGERAPNFREDPYDLGSFRQIAHDRGARGGRAESFKAGFGDGPFTYALEFAERNAAAYPVRRQFAMREVHQVEISNPTSAQSSMTIHIGSKKWVYALKNRPILSEVMLTPTALLMSDVMQSSEHVALVEGTEPEGEDYELMKKHAAFAMDTLLRFGTRRVFAGAPVRAKPLRTYDPSRLDRDPEGKDVPSYLTDLFRSNPPAWRSLKKKIEEFGKNAGLFNEIRVNSFGDIGGSPFQVQFRKYNKGPKGPWRNFVDLGYGVSQALPIVVELFREDMPYISLFPQPEVHLHPSAQAALGSLFSSIAGERIASDGQGNDEPPKRQLIVETHSDYIIDRVRMDVRDKKTSLKPEDVSILYFERVGSDVTIHSLRIDEQGNVLGAPPSYGQFFLEETNRSIGI